MHRNPTPSHAHQGTLLAHSICVGHKYGTPGFVLWFIAMCALRSAVDFAEPALGTTAMNLWHSQTYGTE